MMDGVTIQSQATIVDFKINYSSATIRVFFRIYIGIIFFLISYLGGKCCSAKARSQMMKRKTTVLTNMTGWFSNFDPFIVWWQLRTPPGGWLGPVMVFVYCLHWANDLIVAFFVRDEVVKSRCKFGTGLVLSTHMKYGEPPSNGRPAFLVAQAQTTSEKNRGHVGVYKKVNSDIKFSADSIDVLGRWQCTKFGDKRTFPSNTEHDTVIHQIYESGFLYRHNPYFDIANCTTFYNGNPSTWAHMVLMDSSTGFAIGNPFDVRVSVDLTGRAYESKVMQTWECRVNNAAMNDILRNIASRSTLSAWCPTLQGLLYNGRYTDAVDDSASIIESVFNSFTMVAAGDNYVLNRTAENETQGCLVTLATIHWSVFALTGAAALLCLSLSILWAGFAISNKRRVSRDASLKSMDRRTKKFFPNDSVTWMMQAIMEKLMANPDCKENVTRIKEKDIRKWRFGTSHAGHETERSSWIGILTSDQDNVHDKSHNSDQASQEDGDQQRDVHTRRATK